VWGSSGTLPVIGNGTIAGEWYKNGSLATVNGSIVMGASTTYGTGTYTITLPVVSASSGVVIGTAVALDNSTGVFYTGVCYVASGSNQLFITWHGATTTTAPTVPFTFAVSDAIRWAISYPV
jgi:hypothetical protein